MNAKQLVAEFLKADYETTKAKELEDTHGVRIRFMGDGKLELATSYYYERQNDTSSLYNRFEAFAEAKGIHTRPEVLGVPVKHQIEFHMKSWPKTSWATLIVILQEA